MKPWGLGMGREQLLSHWAWEKAEPACPLPRFLRTPNGWPCGGVRPALACSPGLVCSLADLGMAHPAWGSKCILVPVCFPAAWTCRQPLGAPSAAHSVSSTGSPGPSSQPGSGASSPLFDSGLHLNGASSSTVSECLLPPV